MNKREEVLKRIKNLGIQLEEENFDKMLEIDYIRVHYNYSAASAYSLSSGGMKDQIIQTNEVENKIVETEKM